VASAFGEASFSRAFGLASTATLPLMIAAVFGFGVIFQTQGSYAAGIVAMIAYFVIVRSASDRRRTPHTTAGGGGQPRLIQALDGTLGLFT
jgi:hypothetical protein